MFDLITGTMERPLRERAPTSTVVSIVLHVVVLTLVVGIPLLRVTNNLPDLPTMMAFAVPAPPPPPPPPPPPAPAPALARRADPRPTEQPVQQQQDRMIAPVEAPVEIKTEATTGTASSGAGVDEGVLGGVEGGVAGGVLGGIIGGIISAVPPPPPPPPAPVVPVRVGGQINTPALVHRVEPVYPDVAAAAKLAGTVVLEAVVATNGSVQSVSVLRSRNALLDKAAVAALKQWRYTPLVLNGIPTPFILTVTFTFSTR